MTNDKRCSKGTTKILKLVRFQYENLERIVRSGHVWEVRWGSASPRPPRDGTPSASVWPSPRQTPGPPGPYPSDRTPPDATTKPVDDHTVWSSPSDLCAPGSDGRDTLQGAAPRVRRGVDDAPE